MLRSVHANDLVYLTLVQPRYILFIGHVIPEKYFCLPVAAATILYHSYGIIVMLCSELSSGLLE